MHKQKERVYRVMNEENNQQKEIAFYKDKQGKLVKEIEKSEKRWAEYFQEVFWLEEEEEGMHLMQEINSLIRKNEEPPTKKEIAEKIRLFNNYKSPARIYPYDNPKSLAGRINAKEMGKIIDLPNICAKITEALLW